MIQEDDLRKNLEEFSHDKQEMSAEELLHKLFTKYDTNGNGRISKFEFYNILMHLSKITGSVIPNMQDVEEIFTLMDPDGDRSINETEYNLLMKQFSSIFQERGMKIKIKKKN